MANSFGRDSNENGQNNKSAAVKRDQFPQIGLVSQDILDHAHRNSTPDINLINRSKANHENPLISTAI